MDSDNITSKAPVSVLQGDRLFYDRIISRESSVGCSSRIYYRNADGVPFQWEMQPGKSKNQPDNEVVPPIRAPPAVISLGMPKPCIDKHKSGLGRSWSRAWFWKKSRRNDQLRRKIKTRCKENSEFCKPDIEFIVSPRISSSSASSSSSSSYSLSLQSSRIDQSPARDLIYKPFSCSPWNITGIIVCIARKV